jgi:DNA-binding SARP family transcriptional activator/class 3 adenylate cyclase
VGAVQFQILGPLHVEGDAGAVDVRGQKRRSVLAYLLVHLNEALTLGRIVDDLWPEDATGAQHTVQTYVSQLRKAFRGGDAAIVTIGGGYRLDADRAQLDATRFADLAAVGMREPDPGRASSILREALACWSGAPLTEFRGSPWADAAAEALELQRIDVLERRIDADLELGDAPALVAELDALVRQFPLHERFWAQRMLALYRAGRQGDALRAFTELRTILGNELGIEPGPAIAELELRILDQDETLLDARPAAAPPVRVTSPGVVSLPTGITTFLVTDIVGSTELWDDRPADMAAAVRRHDELIESTITACGGHLLKHRGEGDSTLSVFASAADAVGAALQIRDEMRTLESGAPISVRIALHTGEAEQRDADYYGPVLNRAARLRALAGPNEILCSRATADLVLDSLPADITLVELGVVRLRGLRRGEFVYRIARQGPRGIRDVIEGLDPDDVEATREERVRVELADESRLVAREVELDRLSQLLDDVAAGTPHVVFVRGDPGVGKTRIVHDLLARYDGRVETQFIVCTQTPATALLGLADLVERGAPDDAAASRDVVSMLRSSGGDDNARLGVLTAVRNGVRSLAQHRPAVLVVEDAHWAERSLLEAVELLAHELVASNRGLRVLLVVTRRTFGVEPGIESSLARLERLPGVRSLNLRTLREVDVDELVRGYGVDPPGRVLVRLLYERSRGNPLYVREALRRIADLDGFVRRAGQLETVVPPTDLGAPADLRELVDRRVAGLSPDVLDVLAVAAVAGAEFDAALVAEVCPEPIDAALAAALRAGVIAETAGGYRFTHAVIHAAVYDGVTRERRQLHHRALAGALDRLPEERRRERLVELADHLLESGVDALSPSAARDLWDAGRRAGALTEWRQAARCYESALAIAARTGVDEQRRGWMTYWAGRADEHSYDRATSRVRYEEALEIGRRLGDVRLWGRAALALSTQASITEPGSSTGNVDLGLLAEPLAALADEDPVLRSRMLRKLAEMQFAALDVDSGLANADAAVALARESNRRALLLESESTLAYGHLMAGNSSRAVELLSEARGQITGEEGAEREGFALIRLALGELALGRVADAARTADDALVVFEAAQHHAGACLSNTVIVDILLRQGETAAGEARAREAERLYAVSHYSFAPLELYSSLAYSRASAGDFEGAYDALQAWRETGQRGQSLLRVLLMTMRGERDAASDEITRRPGILAAATTPSIVQIANLGALAEIAHVLDRRDLAEVVLRSLDERCDPHAVYSPGLPFHALRARALALESLSHPDAVSAYQAAVRGTEASGCAPEIGRARAGLLAAESKQAEQGGGGR